jgi:hypothetical protein
VVAALNMGALVFHGSAAGIPSGDHLTADTRLQEQVSHLADFGGTAAGAGDVNGDGYDDLIVGRPGWWEDSYYGATSGAFVFHGGSGGIADGRSASANGSLMGTEIFAKMGSGVAGIGDIDQDGYDDIIVGRGGDHVTPPGIPESALIYLGGPEGFGTKTDLDADMRIEPTATTPGWSGMDHGPSGVGYAMAAAGDVNGDGYGDIIVGGYAEAIDEIEEGTSRVILPEPDALPTLFCCLLLLSVLARARARDR